MAQNSAEKPYTVTITKLADDKVRARVAHTLARVTRNASADDIRRRMEKLPWTLTRRASEKKAAQLVRLLERLGAEINVVPPLPATALPDEDRTVILPGAELLSQTQIMSATQLVAIPTEPVAPPRPSPPASSPAAGKRRVAPGAEPRPSGKVSSEPLEAGFQIEPLSLGGILDRTFQLCRGYFWKLLGIVAIPWLVAAAIIMLLAAAVGVVGLTTEGFRGLSTGLLIIAGATIVPSILVVLLVIFYLAQGALIHAVSSVYLGREILIKEAYQFVVSRLGRFFLTSMLFAVMALLSFVVPVLLGVGFFFLFEQFTSGWWSAVTWLPLTLIPAYCITKLLLFDKVVIIEDGAYLSALRRSWNLLAGRADQTWLGRYFVRLIILLHLFILINLTISFLFQVPGLIASVALPGPELLWKIVTQVMSNIGNLVATVFNSVCMVVFYYDIRNRKEGFDLKMLAGMNRVESESVFVHNHPLT